MSSSVGGFSKGVGSGAGAGAGADGGADAVGELSGTSVGSNGCSSAACPRCQDIRGQKVCFEHT